MKSYYVMRDSNGDPLRERRMAVTTGKSDRFESRRMVVGVSIDSTVGDVYDELKPKPWWCEHKWKDHVQWFILIFKDRLVNLKFF